MKSLLDTKDLTRSQIEKLFFETDKMQSEIRDGKKARDDLKGKSVALLFYENSTRTLVSFEKASQFLGAHVSNVLVQTSSVQKGENLADTAKTLSAFHTDLVVIRHKMSGVAALFSEHFSGGVINGGDGMHAHPTQALYDMYTVAKKFKEPAGRKAVFIGDIKHSRVARSNIDVMQKFGVVPWVYAPKTLLPEGIETLGAKVAESMEEALTGADIVMTLRVQAERQDRALFPSVAEYSKYYGLNTENIKFANKGAIVMHPGPVNWGAEMSEALVKSEMCVKDLQAEYGLALRAALIKELLGC